MDQAARHDITNKHMASGINNITHRRFLRTSDVGPTAPDIKSASTSRQLPPVCLLDGIEKKITILPPLRKK
ncbi:Ubiquinone/menaquinone biosynthesis C-methyltransferase UbiE [Trichinella spiralis]|uniref:Ubiquinone/menaquinone biosynthesis C-methyltransferase UbiE n=1 Tax=Trichinella spiralis TaxID=6334 RepID=A0ABR3KYT3_TRISP